MVYRYMFFFPQRTNDLIPICFCELFFPDHSRQEIKIEQNTVSEIFLCTEQDLNVYFISD